MYRLRDWRRHLAACLVVISLSFPSPGQKERGQTPANRDDEPIKLGTTLVQVPATVSEPGGRYVTDLSKDDFSIFEDGVKQRIEFFGTVEQPFSVALLLDSSGSTAAQVEQIKSAALAFVDRMRSRDRAMVISFNDSVQVQCELTGDSETLRRAVASITPGEFTQVFEAVYTAVWEKLQDVEGRKAVIVFTDGIDNASSEISEEDTLDAVIESEDIIVYPIRYSTRLDVERKMEARIRSSLAAKGNDAVLEEVARSRREVDRTYRKADEYLDQLARMSGGVVERADTMQDLSGAFTRIAEELRRQYLLGYYPTTRAKDARDRKITVEVLRPGMKVRARPAYRATQ
ncbi:MAG: VWA domain-containing protein [Acidobacteriota bacterium]